MYVQKFYKTRFLVTVYPAGQRLTPAPNNTQRTTHAQQSDFIACFLDSDEALYQHLVFSNSSPMVFILTIKKKSPLLQACPSPFHDHNTKQTDTPNNLIAHGIVKVNTTGKRLSYCEMEIIGCLGSARFYFVFPTRYTNILCHAFLVC